METKPINNEKASQIYSALGKAGQNHFLFTKLETEFLFNMLEVCQERHILEVQNIPAEVNLVKIKDKLERELGHG